MFYGNTGFLGFCTILSHFGVERFCMYCTRSRLWKVNKEILRVDANRVYKWMIQSVEFSVFYSDYHCTKFSHRWEQVLKYLPGRPELHARRINMFTRFSFYRAGRIFDAKSDTMGLKKHAGTEFIGRTDERSLDYKFRFTGQDGYLAQVHYGLRDH